MGTYTPNLNLYKPDASDDFGDFREEFNDNMDKLDNGGGGGSGGHTILDGDGNALPQEDDLQFTGACSVSDDNVNGRTVVDIKGNGLIIDAQIYSDNEKVVGVWRDNKPLYQRIFTLTQDTALVADTWVKTEFNKDTMETLVRVDATIGTSGAVVEALSGGFIDGKLALNSARNVGLNVSDNARIIVQYTKTTDVAGSGGYEAYGFSPVIYSDVERKIGVWRDNKPLYAKTVHISALPSSAMSQTYPHNIANIDKICHYESIGRASSGSSVILNRVGLNGSNVNGSLSYDLYVNKTNITISVGQDRSGIETDVTIWYTKTTDVAGSGDYNTYGVPTKHYSANEQVIGTWFGKPLYQKTVNFTTGSSNSYLNYLTDILNPDFMSIVFEGSYYKTGTAYVNATPYFGTLGNDDTATFAVLCNVASNYLRLDYRVGTGAYSKDAYVTVIYTKTTD